MTVLISTHELADIDGVATDVAFLEDGRLLFQESMSDLSARLRRVEILLDRQAREPLEPPRSWLEVRALGNVLSFVETQFSDRELSARIAAIVPGARRVDVKSMPLRSIFTALARSAQRKTS